MMSCQTTILSYPSPQFNCPTEDDVRELADIFKPRILFADQIEAIRLRSLAQRFIDATAYCQEAKEQLDVS